MVESALRHIEHGQVLVNHDPLVCPGRFYARWVRKESIPDQKLEETFQGYGHASVGDMARLSVDMGRVPMHLCLSLFQEGSVNSGQEKSTRYQTTFGKALLHPIKHYLPTHLSKEEALEADYQSFGTHARELFARHKAVLQEAFEQYYQVDSTDRRQNSVLTSRVLDCVRSFYYLVSGVACHLRPLRATGHAFSLS